MKCKMQNIQIFDFDYNTIEQFKNGIVNKIPSLIDQYSLETLTKVYCANLENASNTFSSLSARYNQFCVYKFDEKQSSNQNRSTIDSFNSGSIPLFGRIFIFILIVFIDYLLVIIFLFFSQVATQHLFEQIDNLKINHFKIIVDSRDEAQHSNWIRNLIQGYHNVYE